MRIPEHVVYRRFPSETVVLNLSTEQYHGLNGTGGEMLEALERLGGVQAAARELADRYDEPLERVAEDLMELSEALRKRGLIEFDVK